MIARRGKFIAILLTVIAIAIAGIAPTRAWALVAPADTEPFTLTGAELNGALPALALALGALALTLMFAGKRLSILCGSALLLLGAGIVWASLSATGAGNSVIEGEVANRTGLSGTGIGMIETADALPFVTAAGGVIAIIAGLWVLITARHWQRQPKSRDKYELRSGALAWDVLDEGEDPTLEEAPITESEDRSSARRDTENG